MDNGAYAVLNGMIQDANADTEAYRNENDYIGEDGLLYCGACHHAKQTRLDLSKLKEGAGFSVVRCICKCDAEKARKKQEQMQQDEEMRKIERLRDASLIESRLKDANFERYQRTEQNRKIYTIASKYVENFEDMYNKSQGIIFWGTVGTGKSYTAACIANELLSKNIPVIMTSFVKILQAIQGNGTDESELLARFNAARLLIIDDLGTERSTDYALEKVYNIIDSRYLSGKPLILTTNLTLAEMQENADTRYRRIYDRIFEMCYPVKVAGRSWRMNQAAERYDDMKALLEG